MKSKYNTPYAHAPNIYDINPSFFKKEHIEVILCDLDNTLDSYRAMSPRQEAFKFKNELDKLGIKLIIISNNREKRVKPYAEKLGVAYLSKAGKPFKKRISRFLKENCYNLSDVLLVGDQLMTDIKCAARLGIKSILTEKLVQEDQWTTHINRLFDRPLRRRLLKRGLLIDWRKRYEYS